MNRTAISFEVWDWGDYKVMSIDSRRIDECMRFYRRRKLDGVSVSPYEGYKRKNLSFLKDYPFIEGVVAPYAGNLDLSDLSALRKLKFISLHNTKKSLDYAQFPYLEEIRVQWHSGLRLPETSLRMRHLYLAQYASQTKDCTDLPHYVNLDSLELVLGSTRSLKGLEKYKKLKHLALHQLTKLEGLGDLKSPSLDFLDMEVCRKISDYTHLTTLRNLRVLRIGRCARIPSLDFIKRMRKLEELIFVETDVEDGDLSPCLRLKYVDFFNKRHFSHTREQVHAIIAERASE